MIEKGILFLYFHRDKIHMKKVRGVKIWKILKDTQKKICADL